MKALFNAVLYQPMFNLLIFLAWAIPGHSMAWAIIILTILIRLALLPNSIKGAHAQVKSLEMQPKINKIRTEIKDQAEQSKALMQLYKDENFSPFGSCFPLLIQLPIIWILFAVFRSGLNVGSYSGLYSFLPKVDSINLHTFGIDVTKPDLWVLPIMAGLLQLGLSYLSMIPQKAIARDNKTENDATMMMTNQMLVIAPLITVFFGRTMPAALVIYWITTTIFGIFQQLYVNKQIADYRAGKISSELVKPEDIVEIKPAQPKKKPDMLTNIMNKRLDKQEKKSGVNVTVRTKKK